MWGARVSTCNDDILIHNHCFEHVATNRMRLAIVAEHKKVVIWERKTVSWEQLRLSKIYYDAAFHALLHGFGAISLSA